MPAKKRSVFCVDIHRTLYTYVYVEADSPRAAKRKALDEGPNHGWWDDRSDWGDIEVECADDEWDEEPDLVAEETDDAAPAANPEVIADIIASMVPIPGKGYRMGRFPVTQTQWKAVMGWNPSECKGADRPVENVSWIDCRNFLKKLNALPASKASGLTFRLPTKEEWEFACRAGATGKYCKLADGTEVTAKTLGQVAWFGRNSGYETHPVGQRKPNAFGLYDMHGNVSEWTDTAVDEDGLVDAGGKARVTRGGAWGGSAKGCVSSNRRWFAPSLRSDLLGFRLCADRRAG